MSDTEPSELAPEERDTQPPKSLAEEVRDLQGFIAESNALSILAREASEKCTNRLLELGSRLLEGDRRFTRIEQRIGRIEDHLGLGAK